MPKRIGILGGISHESTIRYYELLMRKYFEKRHDYYYPEVVILSLDFQKFTDFENSGDRAGYIAYIMSGVESLQRAGADFIIMAANSPHAVFDDVAAQAKVPLVSIVEATAQEAKRRAVKNALLLGIKFTMQSPFYPDYFRKLGMNITVPSDEEQNEIDRIIFKELVVGNIRAESKKWLQNCIGQHDTDAVILGCTELPLILEQKDTAKTLLNPLELHVDAALARALGEN